MPQGLLPLSCGRRLAGPISRIDLDRPLDSNVYPELYPLLSKISGQNRKIELPRK